MSTQPATRRRGRALTEAIHLATLEELARTSFAELSFDKIAAAAGTGKAALYRRWPNPETLVLAALTDPATGFGDPLTPPGTGSLRADLMTLLTRFTDILGQPRGRALRPLIAYRHQHPALFAEVWAAVIQPAQETLLAVLAAAAARGEADPARVTPRAAAVGPRMLLLEAWATGEADAGEVAAVVDEILLPLLTRPAR
ncbi:TetR-like C-terminal domain-containing protein [Actinoplanes sp. RD1]|uniref:TetR-like C-terminal domain-containing protein n=1 Tax=Actinoplanes sp. RD1 TaxID=3064538 RepID=UPI0027412C9F|nr:TetR-like C-terminal domain-containing protein [Actinoplanes sp. RD1]